MTPQEVSNWEPLINNTKENDIEESKIKSNHIVSTQGIIMSERYDCDMISEMDAYEEIIKENICFDDLLVAWANVIAIILIVAVAFAVLFAGTFIQVMLEEANKGLLRIIKA